MKPSKFDYYAPRSLDEAVGLLSQSDGEARVLAGGQSLIPMMNFRMAAPAALVDLGKIPSLSYIREAEGMICVGAMTRQRSVEFSSLIRDKLPMLHEAIGWVGHLPTRSRGTIGGSIAHADPATETPMVFRALEGEVTVKGPSGERTIAAEHLFVDQLTTALKADEILTEIRFPIIPPNAGCAVEEVARRHGDFAIVAITVALSVEKRAVGWVRIGAAGASTRPLRLRSAEAVLLNKGVSDAAIDEAADAAVSDLTEPTSDYNGSADFRKHLTRVLTDRAIRRAIVKSNERFRQ